MKNSPVVSRVTPLIQPVVESLGYVLWDVEYVKEGANMFLRITIDTENGITIDDCEKVHRAIDPVLDEADPIPDSYHLEVSSPGIIRSLNKIWHRQACVDWSVELRTYVPKDGVKVFKGTLTLADDDGNVLLTCSDGVARSFANTEIADLRTDYQFED